MVGDRIAVRKIVIRRRNNNFEFIADTYRSYDTFQYPLIFWKGQDGYCINIKKRDTVTSTSYIMNIITHIIKFYYTTVFMNILLQEQNITRKLA
jgi:hypothetical protein